MAPLAHTLALLAMTVATMANEVKLLDMAQDSFDDQYQGCRPAMTAALPALNHSEFHQNRVFAHYWGQAAAEWQRRGSPVSPLSSEQATAVMAFTMGVYGIFNIMVHNAGRSRQDYRDKFHYKTLHFLLTDALATLRNAQKGECLDVFRQDCGFRFEAQPGDTVWFGEFMMTSLRPTPGSWCLMETMFQVHTCQGAGIQSFSQQPESKWVLIPPFETFEVTEVTQEWNQTQILLRSTGTSSKYNCEWLKGGSIPIASFHLGGLLLATTALALATEML
uniref:NAD(P)(+)--arginine ADP-ribosyltransferase n=1 Tax=Cyanoderma ruficeps TaxID=181631 RepID=A0A8C3QN92_9PASS